MELRPNPAKDYDKLKKAAEDARLPFERDAWLNLAFYLGYQYTTWNTKSRAVEELRKDERMKNVPRPVINKIMHFAQQEHGMAMQDMPFPDVLPPTDDYGDIIDSSVAKAYCEYVADPMQTNFERQLSRAVLWAIICQEGYLKWCWNAQEKRPEIQPCSFFEIYPDPYAREFSKSRYVIQSQFMDVEQVFETWGVEVKVGQVEKADLMRTAMLRGMGCAPVLSGVTVNELWYKPCRRYPKGKLVIWTGKQIILESDFPYEHGHLPYTQIGSIERPDSLHYMSPVTYLRPAQIELNAYHQQRFMIRRNFAHPKWWVPSELELETMPDDSAAQVLVGRGGMPGMKPEILQPSAMADNGDGAMLEEQMMHIVGLHEVSQAQVPGRVEAAKAIEILKDSDETRQRTMRETVSSAITEGFWQILGLARQFETEDKMVTAYSREGVPEVKHFRAGKLKPGFRVRTAKTSGLARSRAARQDQLQRMWDSKIITDPEVMAELMEVPLPTFMSHKAIDIREARNENLDLAKGTAIVPNSWDDHQIHLREHNSFRKTHEFLVLDEKVKEKFEHHCQTHEKLLLVEATKQAELMARMQGQPGEPPPNPGAAEDAAKAGDSATPAPQAGTV